MKTHAIEERMLAEAQREVVFSAQWLTAEEIVHRYQVDSENQPCIWLKEKRIFAIEYQSKTLFPSYVLNPRKGYFPVSTLREIINVFEKHERNSWGIAFWFGGLSGFLNGQRPQDLLLSNSELVLAAAKDEVAGVMHG